MHFPVVLRPSELLRPGNPDVLYIAGTSVELAQDCTKVHTDYSDDPADTC
jgi:hypothetical protein